MSETAAEKGAKAKAAAAEKKAKAAAGASKPRAPKPADYTPRLKERYTKEIRAKLKEEFKYTNEMQIPRLEKIVLNMMQNALAPVPRSTAAPSPGSIRVCGR